MMIRDMFAENINRPINGVIKVDQDTTDVTGICFLTEMDAGII